MRYLSFQPVDTWFFRDGRPMHIGEGVTRVVESAFPPPATTVAGAVRAAVARAAGWSGNPRDNATWPGFVGGGEDLGALRFTGPFLLRGSEPLFPMPLHLLGKVSSKAENRWTPRTFLRPSDTPVMTDLGSARLPVRHDAATREGHGPAGEDSGLKTGFGRYLSLAGMQAVLDGGLPGAEHVFNPGDLWETEHRIGIRREETRTTGEGALFSTRHIRLQPGVRLAAAVGRADGAPDDPSVPPGAVPFGGEGRLALIEDLPEFPLPGQDTAAREGRAMLVLLTPADLGGWEPLPDAALPDHSGWKIVGACLEKPFRLGGFSSAGAGPRPLPLTPMLPAGSVLFLEGQGELPTHIGKRTEYGFGHVAVGTWK